MDVDFFWVLVFLAILVYLNGALRPRYAICLDCLIILWLVVRNWYQRRMQRRMRTVKLDDKTHLLHR